MAQKKKPGEEPSEGKPKPQAAETGNAEAPHGAKGEAAFDVWLRRGLHQMFDDVAQEPVPEELLKLIEQDRKK